MKIKRIKSKKINYLSWTAVSQILIQSDKELTNYLASTIPVSENLALGPSTLELLQQYDSYAIFWNVC